MTTDELEREKRQLLERIASHRQQMSRRAADVRRAFNPFRTARAMMGGLLPWVRPVAALVGARKGAVRRGRFGGWVRLALAAAALVPIVRSLLPGRESH
jgi:hypothetical protein